VHQLATGADVLAPGRSAGAVATRPRRPDTGPDTGRPGPRGGPTGPTNGAGRLRSLIGSAGPETLALALAAGVFGYQVAAPSPWRDEGATMVIAARPLGEIFELVRQLDLVHAAYYLLIHVVLLADRSASLADAVPAVRLVSVVAASITAVVLVRIGRRLSSTAVGLGSALALVAAPLVTRYAQEARPYALVMLATSLATLALLRATSRPGSRLAWRLYAAALVLTALLNVISLLVVLGHAAYIGAMTARDVRRRWLCAVAGGVAVAGPFVVATFLQRGQVDWLYAPAVSDLPRFYAAQYQGLAVLLGVVAAAVLLAGVPGRLDVTRWLPPRLAGRLGTTHAGALVLGLGWAVLPVVTLWVVSQVEPLYTWRYIVFTLPGTALAVGSLATVLRPAGLLVPVIVLALSGLHMQDVYRDPHVGHAEDMVGVGEYVAAHARAGDAVLWLPGGPGHMRTLAELYPERYAGLIDVALQSSGAATATITGVEKEPAQIADALHGRTRVWLISGASGLGQADDDVDREKAQLLLEGYRIKKVDTVLKFQVVLWERLSTRPAPGRVVVPPPVVAPRGEIRPQ
jgi:mannosyltransferase